MVCPKCGNKVKRTSHYCNMCGRQLIIISARCEHSCTRCGKRLKKQGLFCPNCGEQIKNENTLLVPKETESEEVENDLNDSPDYELTEEELAEDTDEITSCQEKENSSFQPYSKTSIDSLTAFALKDEQAVKQIIEKEYPVHFDVICQRMSSRCGKSILMIDVVERTRKALLKIKADVKYSEGFFCPNNNDHISARQSGGRPLKYISKEELLAGINVLSRQGVPTDKISNQLKKEMLLDEDTAVIEALICNYLQK